MSDSRADQLTPSAVIWSIMAVTGLWLVGLFVLAVGYTLDQCLGAVCSEPPPRWVWWLTVGLATVAFVGSGAVAVRMTRLTWTWVAAVPGLVFVLVASL